MKKISKVLFVFGLLLLTVGCNGIMNTPTKEVEKFLNKYQTLDNEVIEQLDSIMEDAKDFNKEQREDYHELMKKQYKNLEYKVKDETVDGDNATVEVEIKVFDYGKAINETDEYLASNKEEFLYDNSDEVDNSKYLDYKIKNMEKVKAEVTYTINFNLTRKDNKWKLDELNDIDLLKLHGLYY